MAWIVLAVVAIALVVLVVAPLGIGVSLQGRGEPSGAWAVAGGIQTGPVAVAAAGARGVEGTVTLAIFGRRIVSRPLRSLLGRGDREQVEDELEPRASLERRWQQLTRWVDPVELGEFLLVERRRVRIVRLTIDTTYSFSDVTLTGRLLGALYAVGPLLPRTVELRQRASWDTVDRASLQIAGRIKIWPGLLFLDTLLWLARHRRVTRPRAAAPGASA